MKEREIFYETLKNIEEKLEKQEEKYKKKFYLDLTNYMKTSINLILNNVSLWDKIIINILNIYEINFVDLKKRLSEIQRACLANIYFYLSRNCDLSYKEINVLLNLNKSEQYISRIIRKYVIDNQCETNYHSKIIKEKNKEIKELFNKGFFNI